MNRRRHTTEQTVRKMRAADRMLGHSRPVVAVLSTGDEVYEYDEPLPYGGVRDSNRPALLAAID